MTNAHREYQQNYYDRTYPRRAAALREQLAHPLFCSFNDRLAARVLDAIGPVAASSEAPTNRTSANGSGPPPLRIFEAACGEGFLGAALLRVAKHRGLQLRYSGADLSEGALGLARASLGDQITDGDLVVGDAAEVTAGLPTGSVDVVIAKNLLHHLEEPSDLLREAGRAVGPSGRVVVVEGRLGCPHFMFLAALAPKRERFYFKGTRRNRAAVARAGLDIVHRQRFSFLPYELFFQPRPGIMRRVFSTADPRAIARYTTIDDRLAGALPWFSSYWVWVLAPAASKSGRRNST